MASAPGNSLRASRLAHAAPRTRGLRVTGSHAHSGAYDGHYSLGLAIAQNLTYRLATIRSGSDS
jgi:hypothetical protein